MTSGHLTVYRARRIITMERDLPEATAVGVIDGRIAGVGSLADLQPWLDSHGGWCRRS
jgi:predicted amidohydrolase YtcJ